MMLFCDSFSHYTQPFMDVMWDVVGVPYGENPDDPTDDVSITQGITSGRFGAGGVVFDCPTLADLGSVDQRNDLQYIQRNYDGVSVIHVGLAMLQNSTQLTVGGRLLTFLDSATTQVGIDIMPSGQLRVVRSTLAGTGVFLSSIGTVFAEGTYTVLDTTTAAISSSSYDFLEFKITHHPTAGIVEIRRNGAAFETLTDLNTAVSGNNNSSSVLVGGYGSVWTANFGALQAHYLRATVSDFHLLNTVANGSDALDPVTFIGDRHWEVLVPAADGFYTDWTPNPVNDHYLNVDEIPPDGGTTENNTEPVGNIDTFETDTPAGPATASVIMAYTMYLEKNTGGAVGISGVFRLAGADRNGTEFQTPNPYAFRQSFLASKPGGGAITVADVGSGEHGYERTS